MRRRRRNPLPVLIAVVVLLIVALLGWFWSRGGKQPQAPVEVPVSVPGATAPAGGAG